MVCAHQRRVVGAIQKSNRSNNCRMVCAGQIHLSHQRTDHRPITVQNFRDALLTQIGYPLSVKISKVDAEHNTWARPATGYDGALLGKTACSTGYGVIIRALMLELVRAYQTAGDYLLVIMCLWFWFGTPNTRGQRISANIGGAA